MKQKTAYFCQNCGHESAKWVGKCPNCGDWNTFVEEIKEKTSSKTDISQFWTNDNTEKDNQKAKKITEIIAGDEVRYRLPDEELNRTLGGGLVQGSVTLVAGDPGIGKSTLFLQAALHTNQLRILYVSGEESIHQIKMRADRIGLEAPHVFLLTATNTQTIFNEIKKVNPNWVIIDSIQTLESPTIESAAGSVAQVRTTAGELQKFAKQTQIPVTIIGHITKEGSIAGPKVLEHMVDTVLQFEGDRHYAYRILRTLKNRFGSTSEIGIYEMLHNGLRPVNNPSEALLTDHDEALSGIARSVVMEGNRPLMIEVQALVAQAVYGTPQRTSNGFDAKKLQLILAVLEKRGGFHFGMKDVFFNITGGLRVDDPALDLAVTCALLSSYEDTELPRAACFIGEVGLSGEIRAVSRINQRISEAEKMGVAQIYIPKANIKSLEKTFDHVKIIGVSKVAELYQLLF
ncbi:MAG TPA: DNA repair protein RadA [Edaphocola sp.]|nr:DNA repair protein RadA [Edaphocola sp.]